MNQDQLRKLGEQLITLADKADKADLETNPIGGPQWYKEFTWQLLNPDQSYYSALQFAILPKSAPRWKLQLEIQKSTTLSCAWYITFVGNLARSIGFTGWNEADPNEAVKSEAFRVIVDFSHDIKALVSILPFLLSNELEYTAADTKMKIRQKVLSCIQEKVDSLTEELEDAKLQQAQLNALLEKLA